MKYICIPSEAEIIITDSKIDPIDGLLVVTAECTEIDVDMISYQNANVSGVFRSIMKRFTRIPKRFTRVRSQSSLKICLFSTIIVNGRRVNSNMNVGFRVSS
jgi:hypothetical protein